MQVYPADLYAAQLFARLGGTTDVDPSAGQVPYVSPGYACAGWSKCFVGSSNATLPACPANYTCEHSAGTGAVIMHRLAASLCPVEQHVATPALTQLPAWTAAAPSIHYGCSGELWKPAGRLPADWSFAGFENGDKPVPNVPVVANVKDYGAKGDNMTDDTDAFAKAFDDPKVL